MKHVSWLVFFAVATMCFYGMATEPTKQRNYKDLAFHINQEVGKHSTIIVTSSDGQRSVDVKSVVLVLNEPDVILLVRRHLALLARDGYKPFKTMNAIDGNPKESRSEPPEGQTKTYRPSSEGPQEGN